MTKKKQENQKSNILKIGQIIKNHRLQLSLEKNSRAFFIDDRANKGLLNPEWISEKSLSNIENGYNLPSLPTLKLLSVALEVDFLELIKEIEDFIFDNESE